MDQTTTALAPPTTTPTAPSTSTATPTRRRAAAGLLALSLGSGLLGGATGAGAYALLDDGGPAAAAGPVAGTGASGPAAGRGAAPLDTVEDVAAAVLPSVVSIAVTTGSAAATGSGIVLSEDGTVLTNNHVVEAAAGGSVQVTFHDGTTAAADVVGRDPLTDLAVVRARGVSGLTPATLGSSATLAVGEQVVAIGSPLGLDGTVTTGIVSSLQRPVITGDRQDGGATVIDAVQTDAPINPGNSGGPLVDMAGEVIGINSAIATSGTGTGSIGLGFAIPVDQASPVAEELLESGRATHARLGVSVGRPGDGARAALVAGVEPDGAGAAAGLRPGDLVTKVDERRVTSGDDLVAAVRSHRPGQTVTLTLLRDGRERTVEVTLGSDGSTARP